MAEEIYYIEEARMRKTQRQVGIGFPTRRFLALSFSPAWEKEAMSLPVLPDNDPPAQNPDGTFRFILGVHGLGEAPL